MKQKRAAVMKLASLSQEQLLRLLKAAKNSKDRHAERNWLMLCVGYWHALRTSEMFSLKGTDIRDGFITIRRKKGSLLTPQKIIRHKNPLLNEAPALIKLAREVGDRPLFPVVHTQVRNIFRRYAEKARIPSPYAHFHVLKHTRAMLQVQAGIGIENIRQALGHKSLASTGAYLRVTDAAASDATIAAIKAGKL